MESFLQPPIEGVIIQSYGAGNMPSNRQDLITALREATQRGVLIMICTQCTKGTVSDRYETGQVHIFSYSALRFSCCFYSLMCYIF